MGPKAPGLCDVLLAGRVSRPRLQSGDGGHPGAHLGSAADGSSAIEAEGAPEVVLDSIWNSPGAPVPFLSPFLVGRFGSPTKIDDSETRRYQLVLSSLLPDLVSQKGYRQERHPGEGHNE